MPEIPPRAPETAHASSSTRRTRIPSIDASSRSEARARIEVPVGLRRR